METVEFITPSGHKVYIRPYLTYPDKRELRKIWLGYMSLDAQTQKVDATVNMKAQLEAEEYAVRAMLLRVVDAAGKVYEGQGVYDAVMPWIDEKDGDALFAKINELTNVKQLADDDKKK